jgi:hypothetical protein
MFNHEPFEDFLDYIPARQLALADVYRDATAVIDALGWDPDDVPHHERIEVRRQRVRHVRDPQRRARRGGRATW